MQVAAPEKESQAQSHEHAVRTEWCLRAAGKKDVLDRVDSALVAEDV